VTDLDPGSIEHLVVLFNNNNNSTNSLTRSMMVVVAAGTDDILPCDSMLLGQKAVLGIHSLMTTSRYDVIADYTATMRHVVDCWCKQVRPVDARLLTYLRVTKRTRAILGRSFVKASEGEQVDRWSIRVRRCERV
jgi:hypothetical protein